jgi:hypothetical protein
MFNLIISIIAMKLIIFSVLLYNLETQLYDNKSVENFTFYMHSIQLLLSPSLSIKAISNPNPNSNPSANPNNPLLILKLYSISFILWSFLLWSFGSPLHQNSTFHGSIIVR